MYLRKIYICRMCSCENEFIGSGVMNWSNVEEDAMRIYSWKELIVQSFFKGVGKANRAERCLRGFKFVVYEAARMDIIVVECRSNVGRDAMSICS